MKGHRGCFAQEGRLYTDFIANYTDLQTQTDRERKRGRKKERRKERKILVYIISVRYLLESVHDVLTDKIKMCQNPKQTISVTR